MMRGAEGLAAWLLTYWVHSTLLLAAAWGAGRLIRAPEVREVLWRWALLGALVTATAQSALLPAAAPVLPRRLAIPLPGAAVRQEAEVLVRNGVVERATTERDGGDAGRLWALAALAWAGTAAGAAVLRLLRRRAALAALARTPLGDDDPHARALDALRRRAGIRRQVALTASDRLVAPAAIGRSEVCIPRAAFARLSAEQRDAVLAHELAHLARNDALWLGLAEWTAALLPIQPLNRVARRELREAAELLCDDAAVRHTGAARPLAECLAELAAALGGGGRRSAAAPGVALAEDASPLVRRVRRLLAPPGGEASAAAPRGWPRAAGALASAAALLATAAFAPGVPAPTAADARVLELATDVRRVDGGDGVGAVAFELRALGADGTTLLVSARGALLDRAAGRVVRLLPGGRVRVTQRAAGATRQVDVSPSPRGGRPVYRYTVAGRPAPFDADAERWLAAAIRSAAGPLPILPPPTLERRS